MLLTIVEQRSMSADPKHKNHSHCQSNFSAVEKLNLALNKPAFQKDDGVWGGLASRAVDGNSAAEWVKSSCTHTNISPQAWWAVDLGQTTHIAAVKITNRQEGRKFAQNPLIKPYSNYI